MRRHIVLLIAVLACVYAEDSTDSDDQASSGEDDMKEQTPYIPGQVMPASPYYPQYPVGGSTPALPVTPVGGSVPIPGQPVVYIPVPAQPVNPTGVIHPQLNNGFPIIPSLNGSGATTNNSQLVDLVKNQLHAALVAALIVSAANQTAQQNASTPTPTPSPSTEKPTFTPKPSATPSAKVNPRLLYDCRKPITSVMQWYYGDKTGEGPYSCMDKYPPTSDHPVDTPAWTMLNSYRSGGKEGIHWRYVEDDEDVENCLENWDYYEKDGTTLITRVKGFITSKGDTRRWCAKGQYRPGGAMGKQWAFCKCTTVAV